VKVERHFFHHNEWEELSASDRIYRCYLMAELGKRWLKQLRRIWREFIGRWRATGLNWPATQNRRKVTLDSGVDKLPCCPPPCRFRYQASELKLRLGTWFG
jgi:hypothetical protein